MSHRLGNTDDESSRMSPTFARIMSTDRTHSSGVTHQDFELAEGGGGAVEETGRQPSLVLIAVPDGRAWGGGEERREGGRQRRGVSA